MSDFILTPADRQSGLWRRLRRHYLARREDLRAQNDDSALEERRTTLLRGRIQEITELLALEEDPPAPG